jgi:hypothetical protein
MYIHINLYPNAPNRFKISLVEKNFGNTYIESIECLKYHRLFYYIYKYVYM